MGLFSESIYSRVVPYLRNLTLVLIVFAFVYVAYLYYVKAKAAILEKKKSENIANKGSGHKPATLYYFNTSWCGACRRSKPIWEAFVASHGEKKIVGDYELTCTAYSCDDREDAAVQQMMVKYDIRRFPTVKLVAKDNVIELDGAVVKSNLEKLVAQLETFQ